MMELDIRFPLIGARSHVHSTSILNFLDGLDATAADAPVDLRFVSKVMPGVRVFRLDGAEPPPSGMPPAAAIARIGGSSVYFVNPVTPAETERVPDSFDFMRQALMQKDGQTTLGHVAGHRHSFWDRVIFGGKCHAALCDRGAASNGNIAAAKAKVLSRITCIRADDAAPLTFETEIVLDGRWFRLTVHSEGRRLGRLLGGH
jgi:hypothetical protein